MTNTFWVVAVMADVSPDERRPHLLCERCGERLVQELPIKVTTYVEVAKGFIRAHESCEAAA